MSPFFDKERSPSGSWANIVSSVLLPGSGHVLSGRKVAGVLWFFANVIAQLLTVFLFVSPYNFSRTAMIAVQFVSLAVWGWTVFDSCKKPIPRLRVGAWVLFFVLVMAIPLVSFLVIRQWCLRPFSIPTAAMQPTLMGNRKSAGGEMLKGDRIMVDEWTYHWHLPTRGDIAVFKTEGIAESERAQYAIPTGQFYVKRIVGLPGERVSVRSADIYINGQKLSDPKVVDHILANTNINQDMLRIGLPGKEVQLGADEYFLVGDNVTNSLDSRYYGPVKREYFLGRIGWIYWPAERRRSMD
jgi:signal peptidase I